MTAVAGKLAHGARARVRRDARGVTALAAVVAAVAAVLGVSVVVTAGAALLCLAAWWLFHTWGESPVVAHWRTWAHGRAVVERELRLLGH